MKHTTGGGIYAIAFFQFVAVVLKLYDKLDLSWWWVMSPLWITGIVVVILFALSVIATGLEKKR